MSNVGRRVKVTTPVGTKSKCNQTGILVTYEVDRDSGNFEGGFIIFDKYIDGHEGDDEIPEKYRPIKKGTCWWCFSDGIVFLEEDLTNV